MWPTLIDWTQQVLQLQLAEGCYRTWNKNHVRMTLVYAIRMICLRWSQFLTSQIGDYDLQSTMLDISKSLTFTELWATK